MTESRRRLIKEQFFKHKLKLKEDPFNKVQNLATKKENTTDDAQIQSAKENGKEGLLLYHRGI